MTGSRVRGGARRLPAPTVVTLALIGAGCAAAPPPFPAPPPAEAVPELERRLAERPGDRDLLVQLGAARRAAGRPGEALPLLERARQAEPRHPAAHFFLGLAHEDLGRPGEAVTAYETYLELADDPAASGALEGRLRLLRMEQLRRAAREALAREGEMAAVPPDRSRVAVFPFLFGAEDDALRPLGRALAAMLVTDLSQTDRLTVLERLRVQTLLDEIRLGGMGLVDPATATRSGRLLGAGTVVQGRIGGSTTALALDAAVVEVEGAGGSRAVAVSDRAERLLDMEKALAFDLYEAMGVSLTAAERERVARRPTESLQALLAWGRGLEAADRGDFAEAARHFREAAAIDPGFGAAREDAEASEEMAAASETTTDELASAAAEPVPAVVELADLPVPEEPLARDPAAEVLGTERIGTEPAVLEVILRAPGGGR